MTETHRPSPKVAVDIARESGSLCVTVCSFLGKFPGCSGCWSAAAGTWDGRLLVEIDITKLKQSGKRGGCGRLGKLVEVEGATGCRTTQPPSGDGDGGGTRLITRISTVSCYRAVLQKLFILQTRLAAPNNPTEAANNASCIAAFATWVTTLSPPRGCKLTNNAWRSQLNQMCLALPCLYSASILGTRYLGMQPCQEQSS